MSIVRSHRKRNNFSIIDNSGAHDPTLSLKAKGILWYLLTKPDEWTIRKADLVNCCSDGKLAVSNAFKELQDAGYAFQAMTRGEGGRIEWITEVFETREDAEQWKADNKELLEASFTHGQRKSTVTRKPVNGNSVNGEPGYLVITDQLITDQLITDRSDRSKNAAKSRSVATPPNQQPCSSTKIQGKAKHDKCSARADNSRAEKIDGQLWAFDRRGVVKLPGSSPIEIQARKIAYKGLQLWLYQSLGDQGLSIALDDSGRLWCQNCDGGDWLPEDEILTVRVLLSVYRQFINLPDFNSAAIELFLTARDRLREAVMSAAEVDSRSIDWWFPGLQVDRFTLAKVGESD